MTYRAPVADIAFSLRHAAGLGPALAEGLFGASVLDELLRIHRLTVSELQALIGQVMDAYAAEASPPPNRAIRRSQRRIRST